GGFFAYRRKPLRPFAHSYGMCFRPSLTWRLSAKGETVNACLARRVHHADGVLPKGAAVAPDRNRRLRIFGHQSAGRLPERIEVGQLAVDVNRTALRDGDDDVGRGLLTSRGGSGKIDFDAGFGGFKRGEEHEEDEEEGDHV